MSILELIDECRQLGIRYRPDGRGGLKIEAPRAKLTPEVVSKLRTHKGMLLDLCRLKSDEPQLRSRSRQPDQRGPVGPDRQGSGSGQQPAGDTRSSDGEKARVESIDLQDPCPVCGNSELWQPGVGKWRCARCDPPKAAMRLLKRVEAIQARSGSAKQGRGRPAVEHCPRCLSTNLRDIPIHDGESTRRDCAECGCFVQFSRWYGKPVEKQ